MTTLKRRLFLCVQFLFCFYLCINVVLAEKQEKERIILFQTSMGDIKVKLYNETPLHRDNMIKLVEEKRYDSLLFHRVIQGFMIQGGDPDSKNAPSGTMLGNGNVGYTLPAEIVSTYFHKKGALAAARLGDDVNPKKESSGCQFYIVHGRAFSTEDLDAYEQRINLPAKQKLFSEFINREDNQALKEKFVEFQRAGMMDSLQALSAQIEPILEQELSTMTKYSYSDEQRAVYTSQGGAPHLDGSYTVFGEVIQGMEIVDKIAALKVDGNNRPLEDVRIISATVMKTKK